MQFHQIFKLESFAVVADVVDALVICVFAVVAFTKELEKICLITFFTSSILANIEACPSFDQTLNLKVSLDSFCYKFRYSFTSKLNKFSPEFIQQSLTIYYNPFAKEFGRVANFEWTNFKIHRLKLSSNRAKIRLGSVVKLI